MRGGALAPLDQLAGDGARARVQAGDPRQALEDRLHVALVGDRLQHAALLARPLQAPARLQALLDRVGELEQVQDVLAGVLDLLGAQRAAVPLRVGRGLGQAHAEQLAQQRLIARLRAQSGEPGGDLGVEQVGDLGVPHAAQQRDVLARGVHDHLDRGIGEHLGQRRRVDRLVQRVDHVDAHLAVGQRHRHLHQAQQRAVAALAHELGVDPQPAGGADLVGEAGQLGGGRQRGGDGGKRLTSDGTAWRPAAAGAPVGRFR